MGRRCSIDFTASIDRRAAVCTGVRDFEAHASRRSDDPHILALSSVSGARLLYSNDDALQQDFTNSDLLNNPRGRVYSTRVNSRFDQRKRNLLRNAPPCAAP